MSDDGFHKVPKLETYLPPELEELLARRLVHRALRQIVAPITLVAGALAFLGYDEVTDLRERVARQETELAERQKKLNDEQDQIRVEQAELRRATEGALMGAEHLEKAVALQTAQVNRSTEGMQRSVSEFRDNLFGDLRQMADLSSGMQRQIKESKELNGSLAGSLEVVSGLRAMRDSVRRIGSGLATVETQVRDGRIQTVGARKLNQIVGTPLTMRFDGVTNGRLRRVTIASDGMPDRWGPRDVFDAEAIPPITIGGKRYHITIVNVIDIPTRVDAASVHVRVEDVAPSAAPVLTARN